MPRSSCDVCCNPGELSRTVDSYRDASLRILCDILEALSGGGGVTSNVNLSQVGGVATAVNNGVSSTGTLRVTLASDSTGRVSINQTTPGTTNAVSVSQIGATAVATGNGVVGTGVQRVAIASDNTAVPVSLAAGTALAGKVGIDQTTPGTTNGVAVAQIGSTTVATGNGVVSAGVQRVAIASDNTAFSVNAASVIPGTGATNLGKAEDAPAASGDTAVPILGVRNDNAAVATTTDGDYTVPVANAFGAFLVNIDSTFQRSTNKGLLHAEDSASADADAGVVTFTIREATPSSSFTAGSDGDYQYSKSNANGITYVEPASQAASYGASTTAGAGGAITTTGGSVLTNSSKAKIVSITSTLDVIVQISLDAGTTYPITLPAGNTTTQYVTINLGSAGRWTASNIFAKAIGSNSGSGSLYVGTVI